MLKNFVIVKHLQDSGKYLFQVPKKIALEAGDKVVCDTSRGKDQLGVCCCDTFLADPQVVCQLFGTQESQLKYVTGRVEYKLFSDALEEEEDAEDRQRDDWREV